MTKFDHPDYEGVSFACKDKPTVRDILMYDSALQIGTERDTLYVRLWAGVKWLVDLDKWECDKINPDADIEEVMNDTADMEVVEIMKWAGLAVFTYRQSLNVTSKEKN